MKVRKFCCCTTILNQSTQRDTDMGELDCRITMDNLVDHCGNFVIENGRIVLSRTISNNINHKRHSLLVNLYKTDTKVGSTQINGQSYRWLYHLVAHRLNYFSKVTIFMKLVSLLFTGSEPVTIMLLPAGIP